MQYHGGKARTAKLFAHVLNQALTKKAVFYEPFVGGFNIVPALGAIKAVCSDIHPGLYILYKACQGGWVPPKKLTKEQYTALRKIGDWTNPLTAFAAFGCSFGGKQWRGYASNSAGRNYCSTAQRGLIKRMPFMQQVSFNCHPYLDMQVDKTGVVYCDPPYADTTGYGQGDFNSSEFYSWCEHLVIQGNVVFVSEFNAPKHWEVSWSLERKVTLAKNCSNDIRVEKLFKVVPR